MRSTVPNEVERGDRDTLIESREPMIISLVLDVLIDAYHYWLST